MCPSVLVYMLLIKCLRVTSCNDFTQQILPYFHHRLKLDVTFFFDINVLNVFIQFLGCHSIKCFFFVNILNKTMVVSNYLFIIFLCQIELSRHLYESCKSFCVTIVVYVPIRSKCSVSFWRLTILKYSFTY